MRLGFLLASSLLVSACVSSVGAGRLQGERSLSNTAHGYSIVRDRVRAGLEAQRFEVRPGDCGRDRVWSDCETDRERSEISLGQRWQYGQNMWIGFSVFLPSDFQTSNRVRTTVGQIHQWGGNRPSGTANGLPSFPPLMQLEMLGNNYSLRVHILTGQADNVRNDVRDFHLISINEMRGRWTDVAINFDTSGDSQALEVYINGERRARIEDWIVFHPEYYYFKYGIYRSFVSQHGSPMPAQVLLVDEVRMGGQFEAVQVNELRPVD